MVVSKASWNCDIFRNMRPKLRPDFPYNIEFRAANFQTSKAGRFRWGTSHWPKRKNLAFDICCFGRLISDAENGMKIAGITHTLFIHGFLAQKFVLGTLWDQWKPSVFSKKPNMPWAEAWSRTRHPAQLELKRKTNYDVVCSSVLGRFISRLRNFKGDCTDFMGSRMHPRCFRGLFAEDSYEQWMNGDVICDDDHPQIMVVVVVV